MAILKTVFILLEVLLLFNLLIFVHELGHFLAARWRGLKIDRFAIWFGKPIWKKKINGVEYALGTIPAGGYVALPQMATMEVIEGKRESSGEPLPPISALDKIIVAFAGPLFSFLLAVAFAVVVWGVGRPVNETGNSTTIGWVDPAGPAWKAGLRAGDRILEIDGHVVSKFGPLRRTASPGGSSPARARTSPIKYVRDGKEAHGLSRAVQARDQVVERKALRQMLIVAGAGGDDLRGGHQQPRGAGRPATGDEIVALNGEKIYSFMAVVDAEE